ncbi:MAG: hypothetical protein WC175_03330 [Candidatus Dojkabacteria bacterium]
MALYEWNPITRLIIKRCVSCKRVYDHEYEYCSRCGKKLEETYTIVLNQGDTIYEIFKSLQIYNDDLIRTKEFDINMRYTFTNEKTDTVQSNLETVRKEIDKLRKENDIIENMMMQIKNKKQE